ncbi:MAG: hypothetical protein J6C96_11825 [Oscillospiraceae bacterium]|nr:hypothetical protein [Oscillospiraceae bacterium]
MSEINSIKELEGREPDMVTYAESGRRIEIYGKPSVDMCAEVLFRMIKNMTEGSDKKCVK